MTWSVADIADAVEAGFRRRAEADDAEQAVYGFDALAELGLHPIIFDALGESGWGVHPEQTYPSDYGKRKRSEGKRCDCVLTRAGLPLRDREVRGTIFDAIQAEDPEDAYWLEVKTVAQHETSGPFRRYSAELLNPVLKDVRKLWSDGVIRHAGLLLVLFTEDAEVAEHDLAVWHDKCLSRGLPVSAPAVRGLTITDRIGNAWCSVAVFGVRG
jgi:hypothetical protein